MKSSHSLLIVIASAALSSCASNSVQVIDAKTKIPVSGAAVTGVNGNLSTAPYYTDGNGLAPEPALPNGTRELVVSKSGYNTKHVKL